MLFFEVDDVVVWVGGGVGGVGEERGVFKVFEVVLDVGLVVGKI